MFGTIGRAFSRPSVIAALLLAALAAVFLHGGLRLGLWVDGGPGPGLLPAIVAAAMLGLIAAMLFTALEDDGGFKREPLIAVALLCGFALMAPRTGIVAPTVLLIFAWVKLLHGQSWLRAALLSVALTAAGIGLFRVLLKVPIPLVTGVL